MLIKMLSKTKPKILIMAGGTGGHIFPGLALAEELLLRKWDVSWLGSKGGMEENLVNNKLIKLNLISITGLRNKGLMGWLKMPLNLTQAVFQAIKVIHVEKPILVVGFGGFASGPGGLAAFLTRTPLVIHEQNAIAGMTNKFLAKLAVKVFQAFPGTFNKPSNGMLSNKAPSKKAPSKVETIGNPLRQEILSFKASIKAIEANTKQINILVIGGSRGALALNKNLAQVFAELAKNAKLKIHHQFGKGKKEETFKAYLDAGFKINEQLNLVEFIDNMAQAYQNADIVICRAGALTVSEIAAAGKCALFIPYPYATDDHQTANAQWLVKQSAGFCFAEQDIGGELFISTLTELINSPNKIKLIAQKAKTISYLNATTRLADYCDKLKVKAA